MLTTTYGSFASLTVGCARCHDHKFDPITQQEYYGLQAVFSGANRTNRPRDARLQYNPHHRWWLLPRASKVQAREKGRSRRMA